MEEKTEKQEGWMFEKSLRKHIEDVSDLSWSPDCNFLLSASIDNSAVLWDIKKVCNNYKRIRNFITEVRVFFRALHFMYGAKKNTQDSFMASPTILYTNLQLQCASTGTITIFNL